MTGYQEILTDPSYARQIVTLTYPHIGNTGCNAEDMESGKVYATGLVIRDAPAVYSSWRAPQSLPEFMRRYRLVGIAGVDTRRLTRLLREKGAQNGCVLAVGKGGRPDKRAALKAARAFPGLKGMDLARDVPTRDAYEWNEGAWVRGEGHRQNTPSRFADGMEARAAVQGRTDRGFADGMEARAAVQGRTDRGFRVVAYDYGIKRNILRMLADRGCALTVVPAKTPATEVLRMKPD